jgi:hypothetical protein
MYQTIYHANDNKIGLERKPELEIHQAIIFVRNQFVSSDITYVADQCRELEHELHYPLEIAFFDEEGLNIVFDVIENSTLFANNSLEQFDLICKNINNAMPKVFDGDADITWNIKITSIDKYHDLEDDELPF